MDNNPVKRLGRGYCELSKVLAFFSLGDMAVPAESVRQALEIDIAYSKVIVDAIAPLPNSRALIDELQPNNYYSDMQRFARKVLTPAERFEDAENNSNILSKAVAIILYSNAYAELMEKALPIAALHDKGYQQLSYGNASMSQIDFNAYLVAQYQAALGIESLRTIQYGVTPIDIDAMIAQEGRILVNEVLYENGTIIPYQRGDLMENMPKVRIVGNGIDRMATLEAHFGHLEGRLSDAIEDMYGQDLATAYAAFDSMNGTEFDQRSR